MNENEPTIYDINFEDIKESPAQPAQDNTEVQDTLHQTQQNISAIATRETIEVQDTAPSMPSGNGSVARHEPLSDQEITMLGFLADEVLRRLPKNARFLSKEMLQDTLMKINGEPLGDLQLHEVHAALAGHPAIKPTEGGGYKVLPRQDSKNSSDTMSPSEVRKALKTIKRSQEFREAKVEAKRIANPRRRGKRKSRPLSSLGTNTNAAKRTQGTTHGKK